MLLPHDCVADVIAIHSILIWQMLLLSLIVWLMLLPFGMCCCDCVADVIAKVADGIAYQMNMNYGQML